MLRLIFFIIVMIPAISNAQVIRSGFDCSEVSLFLNIDTNVISNTYMRLDGVRIPFAKSETYNGFSLMRFTRDVSEREVVDYIVKVLDSGQVYIRNFEKDSWVLCVQ